MTANEREGNGSNPVVLVIDDDPLVSVVVRRALEGVRHRLFTAPCGASGLRELESKQPDLVVLDNILPDGMGMDFLGKIHQLSPEVPVLFVTGRGSGGTAIQAMRSNAFDYIPKPLEPGKLRAQLRRALTLRALLLTEREASPVRGELDGAPSVNIEAELVPDALVGECAAMQTVFKAVGKVAMQDVPVLVKGEHGTGKEAIAREIHNYSTRAQGPFVKLHCPGLSDERLEQELFGVERADGTRTAGRIEQAAGGTLVLQEIGRVSPAVQAILLQLFREGTYQPIGSMEHVRVQSRIIAITSDNLEALVRAEQFRSDLYFTLNSFVIHLPALRERHGDLPLLIAHTMRKLAPIARGFGISQPRIADDAVKALSKYTWPGNIDELESVLKRALVEQKGHVLLSNDIQQALAADAGLTASAEPADATLVTDWDRFTQLRIEADCSSLHADAIEETERRIFARVLNHTGGNQAQAARILGITRASLRKKLRLYGLCAGQKVE